MGLDLVELTIAVEDSFGIAIPNDVAPSLATPGQVVDFVCAQLEPSPTPTCLEQRAFYRLRRAVQDVLAVRRQDVLPTSRWTSLVMESRWSVWKQLKEHVGLGHWPAFQPLYFGRATVGQTAQYLAAYEARALIGRDGWHRHDVENVVRRLVMEETGITEFKWTDRFVQDLHLG